MSTKYNHHIHPPSPFLISSPLPLVLTSREDLLYLPIFHFSSVLFSINILVNEVVSIFIIIFLDNIPRSTLSASNGVKHLLKIF
jgi:hypothetical protein